MKKFLVSLLCVMMMVTFMPTMAWADDMPANADRDTTGYGTETLPAGPDMSGDTVTVTPENAQYTLDGAYGDIDGKTIHFSDGEGEYEVLELARPTKYSGSNTVYYNMTWAEEMEWQVKEPAVDYETYRNNPSTIATYTRSVKNVTFTADEGVELPGFFATSGHIYGKTGAPQYNYVLEKVVDNTSESHYSAASLENIKFSGLTISGYITINNYSSKKDGVNNGLKFENCVFTGDSNAMSTSTHQAIQMRSDDKYFSNIVVSNCDFSNYYQGIYIQGADNLQVKNCEFNSTKHNAIAVQNGANNGVKGEINIVENLIKNATDRAIRFGKAASATKIVVSNNIIIESGDDDGELFKAESVPNANVSLENNYWNELAPEKAVSGNGGVSIPATNQIIGGSFRIDPNPYLAPGYEAKENNGIWTVNKETTSTPPPITPPTEPDNVTNDTTDKTTNADIKPSTPTTDGKVEATVDKETADKIVDKAVSNGSTEVIIDAASGSASTAEKVESAEVKVPTETMQKIVDDTKAEVTIKTDAAEVTLDRQAVEAVATQATEAKSETVTLVVEKTKDETEEMNFELSLVTEGGKVSDFKGGKVSVTVKLNPTLKDHADENLVCVYIDDNGIYTIVDGKKNADGTYTFVTGHFSTYAIMSAEEADKIIKEQQIAAVKAFKITTKTELVKGKKMIIKWTVKGDESAIDGYRVYYSTKKVDKGFKVLADVKGKKLNHTSIKTNKNIKKGTRVYYRVKAFKKIDGLRYLSNYSTAGQRTWK